MTHRIARQDGIALITVLLLLITMTVLGIAALTVTGMENRMAGFARTGEAATTTAEACLDTGMQIIQGTLDIGAGGTMPDTFKETPPGMGDPPGPIPDASYNGVNAELLGQDNNNNDVPETNPPDMRMVLNNFTVNGDLDRLYVEPKTGTSQAFDEAATGGAEILYRVDCVSNHAATGTTSRITGVYACTLAADGCRRAL